MNVQSVNTLSLLASCAFCINIIFVSNNIFISFWKTFQSVKDYFSQLKNHDEGLVYGI